MAFRVVLGMMSPHDLARFLDTHGPSLVLYARQWCETPEDVVQEAFLALITASRQPDDPVAWLYRVVRHGAIDAGRSERRRQRREAAVAHSSSWFVEPAIEGLDAAAAKAALAALPLEEREIIVAHLWGGLSFEQASALAGCSASTAHRRFRAGIARLREKLGVSCPSRSSIS